MQNLENINPVNFEELKEIAGDDAVFIKDLLTDFHKDIKSKFQKIKKAINSGSYAEAKKEVNTLKITSGNVCANRFYQSSLYLEKALIAGNIKSIGQIFSDFENAYLELDKFLSQYLNLKS